MVGSPVILGACDSRSIPHTHTINKANQDSKGKKDADYYLKHYFKIGL